MADSNSGHVAAATTTTILITATELNGKNEESNIFNHHINLIFIALIVGSLLCVLFMCIYMIIKKRKCPCQKKNIIDRGDSVVVEEINVAPWKIKINPAAATPVSSPSYQPNNDEQNGKIQRNIRHIADSSGDSVMQLWDNTNNENETDDDDDDDMYLQPKLSVASHTIPNGNNYIIGSPSRHHHGSHHSRDSHLSVHSIISDLNNNHNGHQKKISISANNNLMIETNEISANDELIEGSEYETRDDEKITCIDDDMMINRDGRHIRNLTGGDLNEIEDEYEWIEMAFRQIDEKDWIIYLNRFKKNKVNIHRLNNLVDEDWRELLPEIGIRRDFRNLLNQKNNI